MTEFIINDYLKLELIERKTVIYIKNRRGEWNPFNTCKYLFLNIPDNPLSEKIDSIDEAEAYYGTGHEKKKELIDPETEFWGHCSNLQAWAENNYDTRILHSNLSFPLLARLKYAGDIMASRVLKEEVAKRLRAGFKNTIQMILSSHHNFLRDFSDEELEVVFSGSEFKRFNEYLILIKKLPKVFYYSLNYQSFYVSNSNISSNEFTFYLSEGREFIKDKLQRYFEESYKIKTLFDDLFMFPEVSLKRERFIDITTLIREVFSKNLKNDDFLKPYSFGNKNGSWAKKKAYSMLLEILTNSRTFISSKILLLIKDLLKGKITDISVYFNTIKLTLLFNYESEGDFIALNLFHFGMRDYRGERRNRYNKLIKKHRKSFSDLLKEYQFNCIADEYDYFVCKLKKELKNIYVGLSILNQDFINSRNISDFYLKYHGFSNLYLDIEFNVRIREGMERLLRKNIEVAERELFQFLAYIQKDLNFKRKVNFSVSPSKIENNIIYFKIKLSHKSSGYSAWDLKNRLSYCSYGKINKLLKGDQRVSLQELGIVEKVEEVMTEDD